MPIRVVSKRSGGVKPDPEELVIDIDRGTVLGNPFVMRSESERDSVCERYAEWAVNQYANNKRFAQEIFYLRPIVTGKQIGRAHV